MTDNHHTPEGADGLRKQILPIIRRQVSEPIASDYLEEIMLHVVAEVHASNRRLLEGLKKDNQYARYCEVKKAADGHYPETRDVFQAVRFSDIEAVRAVIAAGGKA
jgi:hypothetical protein